MLGHDFPWDQPHHQQNAERQNDRIVHVAKDGHEVRDQIDRRECVTRDGDRQPSYIPRNPRIATRQPYRRDIALQRPPPLSQSLEHSLSISQVRSRPRLTQCTTNSFPIARTNGFVCGSVDAQSEWLGWPRGRARQGTSLPPALSRQHLTLQALAEPGSVVISASTRRLTGGLFEYRDLETVSLKGLAENVPAWQVLGASAIES